MLEKNKQEVEMEDVLDYFLRKLIDVAALVAVQAAYLWMVRYASRRGADGVTGRAGTSWRAGSMAGPGSVGAGGRRRGHGQGQPCGDGDGSPGSDEVVVVVTDPEGRDVVLDLDECE